MTRIRLTDLQRVLLTAGCHRADGSLIPPPEGAGADRTRIDKAIGQLIKRELVEEKEVTDAGLAWRSDEGVNMGAFVTATAREQLGVAAPIAAEPTPPQRTSRQEQLVSLLRRPEGATLNDIIAATGWLPHSSRAALTGVRKKGHVVNRSSEAGVSRYTITAAA